MRHRQTDRDRIIGAVDHVGAVAGRQPHGEQAQRIIRARTARASAADRPPPHAPCAPIRADTRPDSSPCAITCVRPIGRVPVHLADAHRVGDDLTRLAALRLGVVVEPVLRQIDHDALARPGRQDMPARNDDLLVGPGQPRIDARIDANDLLGAEAVFARQIVERVLIDGRDGLVLAHHRNHRASAAYRRSPAPVQPASSSTDSSQQRPASSQPPSTAGRFDHNGPVRMPESDAIHAFRVARRDTILRPGFPKRIGTCSARGTPNAQVRPAKADI